MATTRHLIGDKRLIGRTLKKMNNNRDVVADVLEMGLACTMGATILAIPFYGFFPLLAVCAGLVTGVACFKAMMAKNTSKKTK
jgi:hypothetical protein